MADEFGIFRKNLLRASVGIEDPGRFDKRFAEQLHAA
jgi:hypothetical protein